MDSGPLYLVIRLKHRLGLSVQKELNEAAEQGYSIRHINQDMIILENVRARMAEVLTQHHMSMAHVKELFDMDEEQEKLRAEMTATLYRGNP
jgi:hypothetical protein